MPTRTTILITLSIAAAVILTVGGLLLQLPRGVDYRNQLGALYSLTCVGTGVFIVRSRPRNAVGWLLVFGGLCSLGGLAALQYGVYGRVVAPRAAGGGMAGDHPYSY